MVADSKSPRQKAPGATYRTGLLWKLGAGITAFLGLILFIQPVGRGVMNLSYDLAYLVRPDIPIDDAVIIYMDVESHSRLGQEKMERWNRGLHARLVDRLTALGARAIAFDVVFLGYTNLTVDDEMLVAAVKRSGRVIVGAKAEAKLWEGKPLGWQVQAPFRELEAVAPWGLVAVSTHDFAIRREFHVKELDAPSLAWRTAKLAFPDLAADPYQDRWLQYYGPPGMLPHYSYWEVLDPTREFPPNVFSNRVVLVGTRFDFGPTGGTQTDQFPTPYTRWRGALAPGVEVNATAVLNLLRGDWLERSSVAAELALVLLAGVVFGGLLSLVRPFTAVILAVPAAVGIAGLACFSVWSTRVWFPWLIVSGVQIPVATAWSILAHTRRLTSEKRALEKALATAAAREEIAREMAALLELGAASPSGGPLRPPPDAPAGPAPIQSASAGIVIPDYALVRPIGKGGYGEVWLARNIIGTYHAAKFVHRHHFPEAAPFEREFNGLRRFTPISRAHPGLVHVLHIGRSTNPECIYYVMELGDDETHGQTIQSDTYAPRNLAKELKARSYLPLPELVDLALQIADAVAYLHARDLIHRDIKPSNIIFVNGHAKLADIGLVTDVAVDGHDVSCIGTIGYMPPEGPGTPGADVYSLGRLLYQAATGMPVDRFPELPSSIMQGAKDPFFLELNRIINRACETDPKARYQTARDLHTALSALHARLNRPGTHARP